LEEDIRFNLKVLCLNGKLKNLKMENIILAGENRIKKII